MEEVATMEIYTMKRPSVLLTAACAPSAVLPATAAAPWATPVLAATRAPISPMHAPIVEAHQVPVQAELAQGSGRISEINGTTGFQGLGVSVDSKRYVDARGIPPRGRPV
jgi:hypothetical protein